MAKHEYILDHDYLDAKAQYYKRGDKIVLDEKDSAVALCLPLGQTLDDEAVEEVVEKPVEKVKDKPKTRKSAMSSLMD